MCDRVGRPSREAGMPSPSRLSPIHTLVALLHAAVMVSGCPPRFCLRDGEGAGCTRGLIVTDEAIRQ